MRDPEEMRNETTLSPKSTLAYSLQFALLGPTLSIPKTPSKFSRAQVLCFRETSKAP